MIVSGGKKLVNNETSECQEDPELFEMRGCYVQLAEPVRDHKSKVLGLAITSLLLMVTKIC